MQHHNVVLQATIFVAKWHNTSIFCDALRAVPHVLGHPVQMKKSLPNFAQVMLQAKMESDKSAKPFSGLGHDHIVTI